MLKICLTGIISFASTNIDNIFILIILFSQVGPTMKKRDIVLGEYLGISFLVLVSILISYSLSAISTDQLAYLGWVPILLGLKTGLDYLQEQRQMQATKEKNKLFSIRRPYFGAKWIRPQTFSVVAITVANGADNIGIYVPIFSRYTSSQVVVTLLVFAVMLALWCYLGEKILNFPFIKKTLERYKHILVPVVFIALGCYILMG